MPDGQLHSGLGAARIIRDCRSDLTSRRHEAIRDIDLSKLDAEMSSAVSNTLVNDACGLRRGRLILPSGRLPRLV